MTEPIRQYAIRLPNGLLHAHTPSPWVIQDGLIRYLEPDEDEVPTPVVYDTLEDAEYSIQRFQKSAAHMGITHWLGQIESRTCSEWTETQPSESMLGDIESFLEDQ